MVKQTKQKIINTKTLEASIKIYQSNHAQASKEVFRSLGMENAETKKTP